MAAGELLVHWQDDQLRVSAPRVHFLSGIALERLHDGAAVPFDVQLSLTMESKTRVVSRSLERFIVSYDLWEEKFSVRKPRPLLRSVSHLSASAAEAWCMENVSVSTNGIDPDQPLWVRLDVRTGDLKDPPPMFGAPDDGGISLASLIEIFSRPARRLQPNWMVEAGPMHLSEIKRMNGRGT